MLENLEQGQKVEQGQMVENLEQGQKVEKGAKIRIAGISL